MQLRFETFPELTTQRLKLRALAEDDLDLLHELRSDPESMRWLDRPLDKTLEDTRALMERMKSANDNAEGLSWIICRKEDTELMGYVGFWRWEAENFRTEVGYMIRRQFEGKGYMTEALNEALEFGFKTMGFHTIKADINPGNDRSVRLVERAGFVREAYFRENLFYNGKFLDTVIYTMHKADWMSST